MGRARNFLVVTIARRDWLGLLVLACLIAAGGAAVSILFSQTMKEAALKRFHLASDGYKRWAIHQAVPSMYNFENRIRFSNVISQSGNFNTTDDSFYESAVNHFPARFITFGDERFRFANQRDGMFEMVSVFQDTTLRSRWNLIRDESKRIYVDQIVHEFEYERGDE